MRFTHIALCVATLLFAAASEAAAMTFEKVKGSDLCAARECVLASGDIDADSPRSLKSFLRANNIGAGSLLILNSRGGDLLASLAMGTTVREARLSTLVQAYDRRSGRFRGGQCASACVYVLLGGVERGVGEGAKVGVHQLAANGDASALSAADSQWLMSLVAVHVSRMCGDLKLLVPTLRTRPQDMYWLSSGELVRTAVVTQALATGV